MNGSTWIRQFHRWLSITFTLRDKVAFHRTAWFNPTRALDADDAHLHAWRRHTHRPEHIAARLGRAGMPVKKAVRYIQLEKDLRALRHFERGDDADYRFN